MQLDGTSVKLTNGAQLDLGGIAKGYAAGRVRTILQDAGAEFQKRSGLSFEAVFVTDDNTVWITPGLAGQYRADRPYQILT